MTLRVAKEGLPGPFRPPYTSRIHARGVARTLLGQSLEVEFSEVRLEGVLGSIGQNAYSAATPPTLE